MPIYRKCPECGKKILEGTLCICEEKKRKQSYKDYKIRRLQDEKEKERQKFYSSQEWMNLSYLIKRHFFEMCLVCWTKGLIEDSEYTHHIETLKDRFDLRLVDDNLIPLCDCCHKKIHKLMDKSERDKVIMQKTLKYIIVKFNNEYY